MIRLRPDCLVFETAQGENIPCSAKEVTIELIGDSAQWLDSEIVENAAAAVLHYFRVERGQESVSVAEFAQALENVLRGLGLNVKSGNAGAAAPPRRVFETDLRALAGEPADGGELFFFPRLRHAMRQRLDGTPRVLRFRNLRACVKQLTGAKRWTPQCRDMEERIVDYLRTCLGSEKTADGCGLVVE